MFILRPVRKKFSDLNRSAVRKGLPTPALTFKSNAQNNNAVKFCVKKNKI